MDTKLTVRVEKQVLVNAKRYAVAHRTTLTKLISAYLQQIPSEPDNIGDAPIVRQLTGLLSGSVSKVDYQNHLDEKYGRK